MNIAISGASGFIGTYLTSFFQAKGYGVIPITRALLKDGLKLKQSLLVCEVVINLAGANINRRWSRKYKKELTESRIATTKTIACAIERLNIKPHLLISASAVGFYASGGCHDEYSGVKGEGFLSDLCMEWEESSRRVMPEVRVVNARFGVVLSKAGGAFPRMISGRKAGFTVIPGSGRQYLSWIDIADLAAAMEFIINTPRLEGVVNFTAPCRLTYREFAKAVARHYHTPFTLRIPARVLQAVMGEAAGVLTESQCAEPAKLPAAGFTFRSPTLEAFLGVHRSSAHRSSPD